MDAFTPTARTRVRRHPERARYDREAVYAILDAAMVCHVGYVIDGQPYVTPTAHWREGDRVYWHGSSASRMLRHLGGGGVPVSLTVTLLDGLVLARTGFNHSLNYRSAMLFGTAERVEAEAAKLVSLRAFVERFYPGRWDELRPPTRQELKATTVLHMEIAEASAKVRSGPPKDSPEDFGRPCWAGVVPLALAMGPPIPDPNLAAGIAPPACLARLPGL
ncbi:MAG: pyridoxamine 5'-phosphate oxidase family protein [Proteobacteria bacterium]|nr:pyridoxamine 5'-phosphate oxidase family protein [Pseudomonadota bacterium]